MSSHSPLLDLLSAIYFARQPKRKHAGKVLLDSNQMSNPAVTIEPGWLILAYAYEDKTIELQAVADNDHAVGYSLSFGIEGKFQAWEDFVSNGMDEQIAIHQQEDGKTITLNFKKEEVELTLTKIDDPMKCLFAASEAQALLNRRRFNILTKKAQSRNQTLKKLLSQLCEDE